MPCSICITQPDAHSFLSLGKTPLGVTVLYTCPAKAKHFVNNHTFLSFFEQHLEDVEGKPWVWVFDCQQMGMKHMTSLEVTRGMIDILQKKHAQNLQGLYIVHETSFFRSLFSMVLPFLKKETRTRIGILSSNTFESLVELEKRGIPMSMLSVLRESA